MKITNEELFKIPIKGEIKMETQQWRLVNIDGEHLIQFLNSYGEVIYSEDLESVVTSWMEENGGLLTPKYF